MPGANVIILPGHGHERPPDCSFRISRQFFEAPNAPILEGFRSDMLGYDQDISEWRIDVNDIFGTADRVAVRWTFHGRLRDNGRQVSQTGNWIGRIQDGKVVEVWEATDE
jgi:predicted ester cyclase